MEPPRHRATTPVPAVPGGGSPGAGRAAGGIHLAGGDGEGFVQDVEDRASPGGGGGNRGLLEHPKSLAPVPVRSPPRPAPLLPEQGHPLRQAAHQEVGVGVAVHVHAPAERVPKILHGGVAQVRAADHLGKEPGGAPAPHQPHGSGGRAPCVPAWGVGCSQAALSPLFYFFWGGSVPGWVCPAAPLRCCGRCRPCPCPCPSPRTEPPRRCLGGGEEGSAPPTWGRGCHKAP